MSSQLKLDWCSFKAAEFACKNWHYSKCVPAGKIVKIGVWENEKFIGCVLFSRGANNHIGGPYGLDQTEVCELTRVALTAHETPVTRIVSIAIRMLRAYCPGMKAIISYADEDEGHAGGIYKAGNWIYEGLKNAGPGGATVIHGKKVHNKTLHSKYGHNSIVWLREHVDPEAVLWVNKGKHKFVMPLDKTLRERLEFKQKAIMRRRGSSDPVEFHSTEDGVIPISAHHEAANA